MVGVEQIEELVGALSSLADDALEGCFRDLELAARRLEGELAAVIAEVDRRWLCLQDGHGSVRAWVRGRGGWSESQCTRRLRLARLVAAEPSVGQALVDGRLGVAQAEELAAVAANPRCGHELGPVLPELLDHAHALDFGDFRTVVRRWETLADVDGAHRARAAAHTGRHFSLVEVGGVLHIQGEGGALEAIALTEIFDRFCQAEFLADVADAKARMGDDAEPTVLARTDAQRRFDALVAIFEAAASAPPDSVPPAPVVNLNCDIVTFLEHLARKRIIALRPGDLPELPLSQRRCESTGGIPVTPEDVFLAAVAGHVRRVVYDSEGLVVDLGRRRRLFTGASAEALRLAMPRCGHRGCIVRGRRCQLDHLEEWQDDGFTDQENGALRCPSHHRAKRRGFRVWRDEQGRWHTFRPDGTEITQP